MIRTFCFVLLAIFTVLLFGCGSAPPQLPTQYATLKLIERGAVTPAEVIERVERVRGLITEGAALVELGGQVREAIGYTSLAPSDRLLVDAILGDVSTRLSVPVDVPLSPEAIATLTQTLDWIEQAARLY